MHLNPLGASMIFDPITPWLLWLKHINTAICEPHNKLVWFLWMCCYGNWVDAQTATDEQYVIQIEWQYF